jgi:hypothetical protein
MPPGAVVFALVDATGEPLLFGSLAAVLNTAAESGLEIVTLH